MIEGMAAAGAEEVFPYEARESYLHFGKEELAAQQQDLAGNAGQFLDLIREGAGPEQYGQWFHQLSRQRCAAAGGYLLGTKWPGGCCLQLDSSKWFE